jgi:hypothetical protein
MRRLISNSPVVPALASPKPTVQSCLLKKPNDDVPRARQIPGSCAASPGDGHCTSKLIGTLQGTPIFYSHLPQQATLHIACRFNTHTAAVGPRFSTTDF